MIQYIKCSCCGKEITLVGQDSLSGLFDSSEEYQDVLDRLLKEKRIELAGVSSRKEGDREL